MILILCGSWGADCGRVPVAGVDMVRCSSYYQTVVFEIVQSKRGQVIEFPHILTRK